jgi:Spy/CpxP family protein refolding chaperone
VAFIKLSLAGTVKLKTKVMVFNKIIRNCLAAAAMVASLSATAQQGPRRSPEERAQRQTAMMQQKLGLSEEQSKKVYGILLYYVKEADVARADAANGTAVPGEKKAIKRDKDTELQGVLTVDQYRQYQQMMQQRKEMMQQRGGRGGWEN